MSISSDDSLLHPFRVRKIFSFPFPLDSSFQLETMLFGLLFLWYSFLLYTWNLSRYAQGRFVDKKEANEQESGEKDNTPIKDNQEVTDKVTTIKEACTDALNIFAHKLISEAWCLMWKVLHTQSWVGVPHSQIGCFARCVGVARCNHLVKGGHT